MEPWYPHESKADGACPANPGGERCPPALALQRQKRKEWEVRRLLRVLELVLSARVCGVSAGAGADILQGAL